MKVTTLVGFDVDIEIDYHNPKDKVSITIMGESPNAAEYSFQCGIFWHKPHFEIACEVVKNAEDPPTLVWHKVGKIPHPRHEAPDFMHTSLRAFMLDCCADLFLEGFYVVGSYEYEGQTWEVQPMDKAEAITLPDGFDDL